MIIPSDILEALFSSIPTVVPNDTIGEKQPVFGHGDAFDLTKFILKKGDAIYPLIWMLEIPGLTDDKHHSNGELCSKNVELIIATRETRTDLLRSERFNLSFKYVLNPIAENVMYGFNSSNTTRMENGGDFSVGRFTDLSYKPSGLEPSSTKTSNESATIDMWDAIRIKCKIEFNGNCQNLIKWINNP